MICGNCDKTDGLVYTSLPPKVRCKISNSFHEMGDECNIEWKPVVHGHWITITDDIFADTYKCSECDKEPLIADYEFALTPYCPFCGAKMDEVEE